MLPKYLMSLLTTMTAAAALVGCGGGGGDSSGGGSNDPALAPNDALMAPAQGIWTDTTNKYLGLLTPNREVWAFQLFTEYLGFAHGAVTSVSSTSVNFTEDWYGNSATRLHTNENRARVTPQALMDGTSNQYNSTHTWTWQARYEADFDQPARLSDITGTWTATRGYLFSLTISASGDYTTSSNLCSSSGRISPDSSGKYFYRLAGRYATQSGCKFSGLPVRGVVLVDSGSPPELAIMQLVGNDGQYGAATLSKR